MIKLNRYKQHLLEDVQFVFKMRDLESNDELQKYYQDIRDQFQDSFKHEFLEKISHQIILLFQAEGLEVLKNDIDSEEITMLIKGTMHYVIKVTRNGMIRLHYVENDMSAPNPKVYDFMDGVGGNPYPYSSELTLGKVGVKFSHPEKTIWFPQSALLNKEAFEKYIKTAYMGDLFWYGEVCIGGIRYTVKGAVGDKKNNYQTTITYDKV
jgi:hypothetical protein